MNSLANIGAAEKILYLEVMAYNEKWCNRAIRGFCDTRTKEELARMYEERYPKEVKDWNKNPPPAPSLGLRPLPSK
jgi:hypothetical protein